MESGRWSDWNCVSFLLHHAFCRITLIHSLVFSLEGRTWQEPEPSHVTCMALAHCILGRFLGVVCHCFPPHLDVPTLAARCLRPQRRESPSSERWNCGRERCPVVIFPKFRLPHKFRDLRKSTPWDRWLYFLSEGRRAEDFFALKIRRLRPGLNQQTWVLKASTLPLDHRSPFNYQPTN